jgi:hypothetical protein
VLHQLLSKMPPLRQTNHGMNTRPSDNPQREDLIMKRKKERAALMQREKKIANWSTILAEIHRLRAHGRTVAARADPRAQDQLVKRFVARATLSPIGCHRFCKPPKRGRSTATPQTIDRRNNHRSSRASRHSPSNTTMLLASKAPALSSLRLFLADSRNQKYSVPGEIFKHIFATFAAGS